MAYPEDVLGVRIEIAPDADRSADPATYPWQDVSTDWRRSGGMGIVVGGQDEQAETNSSATFDLRNMSSRAAPGAYAGMHGRYTDDNPLSDLYGLLLNCPVRLSVDPGLGDGYHVRAVQYIGSLVDEYVDMKQNLVLTHITTGGLFRQLTQGKQVMSALRRTCLSAAAQPTFYFPLEATTGALTTLVTEIASEGTRDAVMRFGDRGVDLGEADGPPGSDKVAVWPYTGVTTLPVDGSKTTIGSSFRATLQMPATGQWAIAFSFRGSPPGGVITKHHVWRLEMQDSTGNGFHIYFADIWDGTGAGLLTAGVFGTDAIGGVNFQDIHTPIFDNRWHHVTLTSVTSGSDYIVSLYFDGMLRSTFTFTSATIAYPAYVAGPFADAYTGTADTDNTGTSMSVTHLGFYSGAVDPAALYQAHLAFLGEQAHVRIARLAAEEGVPSDVVGSSSSAMGPQAVSHVVALLREAGKVDRGVLTDHMGVVGYRAFSELVNQSAAITIDAARRELFRPHEPTTDDARVANDVTASALGQAVRVTADSATIARMGRYASTISPNVGDVTQLPGQAGWTVHEGTLIGKRYPSWTIDLLRAPTHIADWLTHQLGDRSTIINPPRGQAPIPLDLMSRGWSETIRGGHDYWGATINAIRYDPYFAVTTIESGSGNASRLSGGGTQLAVAVSSADTAWDVIELGTEDSAFPVRWIDSATYPSMFPFDMTGAGDRVTVSAIADIARDAFGSRTNVASWGTPDAGPSAWTCTGAAASGFAVASGTARITPTTLNSDWFATLATPTADNIVEADVQFTNLPASGTMRAGVLMRWASTTNYVAAELTLTSAGVLTVRVVERAGGVQTVLATTTLNPAITVATTTWFRIVGYVVGTAVKARAWRRERLTSSGATFTQRRAPTWQVEAVTSVVAGSNVGAYGRNETAATTNTLSYDNWLLASPQAFTVVRGVDGFSKALPAGQSLGLYRPGVYSL
jgi:hypothetical protein